MLLPLSSYVLAIVLMSFLQSGSWNHDLARTLNTERSLASPLSPDEKRLLLLTKKQALFLTQGNASFISAVTACVNYQAQKNQGKSAPDPGFIMKIKGVLGNDIDEAYTCREILSRYFGYKAEEPYEYRKTFRTMQYLSILAQAGDVKTDKEILEAESLNGNVFKKIGIYDHPLRTILDKMNGDIPKMPKPADVVVKKAFETYQKSIHSNCQSYLRENRQKISKRFNEYINSHWLNNLCTLLVIKNPKLWDEKASMVQRYKELSKFNSIRADYLSYASHKRRAFREDYKRQYLALVAEHPHFLLIPKLELSLADIQAVAKKMKVNQQETLVDITKLEGEELLNLLPVFSTFPMTISSFLQTKHGWSEAKIQQVAKALQSKKSQRELKKSLVVTALAIGGTIACTVIPQGKALGVAVTSFSRGACLVAMGTGVDIYFLLDAAQVRSAAFRQFAMTAEAEYAIFNADRIDEGNKNLLFSLVFIPLGIQPRITANTARELVRRLK